MSGDEIVITGISGKFPKSENVEIFQQNLLRMENCLTSKKPKWKTGNTKFPQKSGQISGVAEFDSQSFGIHKRLAENLDPMIRMILQCSYESIADAGVNPRLLKGKKVAVFLGIGTGEVEQCLDYNPNEYTLIGRSKAMIANRISFLLNLQGPSMNFDSADTSSGTALENGYFAIKSGKVESAIIASGSLTLHPYMSLHLLDLGLLSSDGLTKSFDRSANGYARSEAIVVLFLQKARDAKRIYAEIKNIQSSIGPSYDRLSVSYPTSDFQTETMKSTLKECGLSGKDVSFVEADGLGIKEADIEEIKAIDQAFYDGRKTPLLVGSVKSNIGSCHAANTLVSIIKVITMFESGKIPPNLHYKNPSEQMSAIHEGRIKVVTEPTPWDGEYVAVNTTSMGGCFTTVILKSFKKKEENILNPSDNLPRLTMVSGVTEDAVNTILDFMESKPVNSEMFQLINDIFEVENISHLYRGYSLLPPSGVVTSKFRGVEFVSGVRREIWYVFSGMGSQWIGMGKTLMNLPVFLESVNKCDAVLRPHGIDVIHILTSDDLQIFDNIINTFVGIITIQIGLVDLLNYLGIKPDFMIGHSVGELGCAYADGCLTAEQTVLNAIFRGFASVEAEIPKGSMAAVGLGYESIKPLCPPDIDVACHNSVDSSTISGPTESITKFMQTLQAKGVFVKEVQTSNIAYHSRYIAPAGPKLLEYLKKIVPDSKVRSSKWISTSVPKNEWVSDRARFSSAEYYVNNLLSPVFFEEVIKLIPKNAITIEIAPHGLLQAILKRSLPSTVTNLSLTKRDQQNSTEMIMDAIGKFYIHYGSRARVERLYPRINYPVSVGTPSISSVIRWNQSKIWCKYFSKMFCLPFNNRDNIYKIDLSDKSWKFIRGYKIGNQINIPCSLYLELAFTTMKNFDKSEKPISFKNIVIHKNHCINEDDTLELRVMVQGSGNFEITKEGTLLCSGIIKKIDSFEQKQIETPNLINNLNEDLESREVYNELLLREYQFSRCFETIYKYNLETSFGYVFYQEKWFLFLEGMLQMYMLNYNKKTPLTILKIQTINIDLYRYKNQSQVLKALPVSIDKQFNNVRSYGLEVEGVQLTPVKQQINFRCTNVEEIKLTLNFDESLVTATDLIRMVSQALVENNVDGNIIHLIDENVNSSCEKLKSWRKNFSESSGILHMFEIIPSSLTKCNKLKDAALQVLFDVSTLMNTNLLPTLKEGDFVLAILESLDEIELMNTMKSSDLGIVLKRRLFKDQVALLFRKKRTLINTCILDNIDKDSSITNQIGAKINSSKFDRIIIAFRHQHDFNKCEKFNILSSEEIENKVRYFEINNSNAAKLSMEDPFYRNQLQLDLKFNILTSDGNWGSRRCFPIPKRRCTTVNSVALQARPGDLDSLDWYEQSFENSKDNEVFKVEYTSINAFDVRLANNGEIINPYEICDGKTIKTAINYFGLEYSGTNLKGDRIMGLSRNGTFCSFISPDSELTWDVPNSWTLKEAATVPLAYSTAYMALYLKGEIRKKRSVFIYDGSSALGQAAINLALNEESRVFVTYKTKEEKMLLKQQYPSFNEDQLFCSNDPFEDMILSLTKGVGVELIIYNSCDMNRLESCLAFIKYIGRVIIVGELQDAFEKSVGMYTFFDNVSIYSIIPHNLVNADVMIKKNLSSLMKDGLKKGVVKPLFLNLYYRDDLKKAFIDASHNLSYRKVVVKVQQMDSDIEPLTIPRFLWSKSRTYLLISNNWNNLFAIKLVDYLIEHGAKHIFVSLTTENATKSLYAYHSKIWQENEVQVVVKENLRLFESFNAKSLFIQASKQCPIDVIFDLQRLETLTQNSLYSKYLITKNLFEQSKEICNHLRDFVIFTTPNNADNDFNAHLFQERYLTELCEKRFNEGLPTRLILWDTIEKRVQSTGSTRMKNRFLTIARYMQELDKLMTLPCLNIIVSNDLNNANSTMSLAVTKQKTEKELFEDYIFNR